MSLPATKTFTSEEAYHQILPRFILRQFLPQNVRNSWRAHNAPSERLSLYDLAAGHLRRAKVYNKMDVFKDMKRSTDVEYAESKLKDLEDEAAGIVRTIHFRLESGTINISRADLSILRKFIFVTHYHRQAMHFREAGVESTSLLSGIDAWLQGLKYYLDTAHHDIITTGERLRERYENSRLSDMLRSHSYPAGEELEFQYAIEYEDLANKYFLGIWVAAEENEFVLSGNAFSHWEGRIDGMLWAHRLHVLTPRIAIILRRTCLHDPHPSVLHSTLAEVPISQPRVCYAKEDLIDILENCNDPAQAWLVINAYRTTPEAEQDSFTYSFTRLSPEQTYAVNEVVMMNTNLQDRGFIIFREPSVMRETVDLYMTSPNTYAIGGKQRLYHPLLAQLAELGFQGNSQVCSPPSPSDGKNESAADCQLSLLLGFMIQNHVTFPSAYTRAFLIFHMATVASSSNPISQNVCKIQDAAIDKLRCLLDPPLPEVIQDSSNSGLVQSLTNEESELFFSLIAPLLEQANIIIRRSNDFFATVINEAAVIGVTYWLAEERPDVLRDHLVPWVHIWA